MKAIRKFAAAALMGAAALAVSGCAASLPTKVTRFQAMPAPQGQSFFIVPGSGAASGGGLEFQRYAGIVTQQMQARGYVPAASPQSASMVVQLGYGVDEGKERVVDYFPLSRGRYGPYGFGSRFGYYDPFWDVYYGRPYYSRFGYHGLRSPFYYGWDDPFYMGSDVRVYTEYKSQLEVDIRDRRTNQSLFEGKAIARSQTDELGTLVPNLIEAMFTGFPGKSGETVKITVPARKKA